MIRENIIELKNICSDKNDYMDNFYKLTKDQNEAIKENKEDMEILNEILEKKSKIIKKVDLLDKRFLLEYDLMKDKLNIESFEDVDMKEYPEIKEVKFLIESILEKLKNITELDKENNELIKVNMDIIKSDLRNVKGAQIAHKGYSQQGNQSILIDERK